jgi:hypothetical protein
MQPHDFSKSSTAAVDAHSIWQYTCSECNWTQVIATAGAPPVKQCGWCGWPDPEAKQAGAFATLNCKVHGNVTCVITAENISTDDFMDLFCPHCERK